VQREIEAPLSKRIIAGDFEVGDTLVVTVEASGEGLTFERREAAPIPIEQVIGETSDRE
jgi:hypothetical protein